MFTSKTPRLEGSKENWPTFDEKGQKTMYFDKTSGARTHPDLDKLRAFDAHYAKLREEAKAKK